MDISWGEGFSIRVESPSWLRYWSGMMLSGCVSGVFFASEYPLELVGVLPCLVETVVLVWSVSRSRGLLLRQDRDPVGVLCHTGI